MTYKTVIINKIDPDERAIIDDLFVELIEAKGFNFELLISEIDVLEFRNEIIEQNPDFILILDFMGNKDLPELLRVTANEIFDLKSELIVVSNDGKVEDWIAKVGGTLLQAPVVSDQILELIV